MCTKHIGDMWRRAVIIIVLLLVAIFTLNSPIFHFFK